MSNPARPLFIAALSIAALGSAACDDDLLRPQANFPVFGDTATVFATNGTAATAPSALTFYDGEVVRADVRFAFDLAFDIDADGMVRLIPVRKFATLGGGHPVGMQIVPGDYQDILEAPSSGFRYDSTFSVSPGQVVVVESGDPVAGCSAFTRGATFYSKLVVLSVDDARRTVRIAFTVDPNCGFRSLVFGELPER
jgi:hypothetical protein